MSKEFWNTRYKENSTVYGFEANEFFKEQLLNLQPGHLLLPGEGEGRNALFALRHGWKVHALDYSLEAQRKALALAHQHHFSLEYYVQDIERTKLSASRFDAIALIYLHLPAQLRRTFHLQCVKALKQNGVIILEAFSKEQINNTSGGPSDVELLYSRQELYEDFSGLHIEFLQEEVIELIEGNFHKGQAAVVRMIARKV